jgi:hypothetical protein
VVEILDSGHGLAGADDDFRSDEDAARRTGPSRRGLVASTVAAAVAGALAGGLLLDQRGDRALQEQATAMAHEIRLTVVGVAIDVDTPGPLRPGERATVTYRLVVHNAGASPLKIESVDVSAHDSVRLTGHTSVLTPELAVGGRSDVTLTLGVDCRGRVDAPTVRIVAHSVGGPQRTIEQTPIETDNQSFGSLREHLCDPSAAGTSHLYVRAAKQVGPRRAVLSVHAESEMDTRLTKLQIVAPGITSTVRNGLPAAIRRGPDPSLVVVDVRVKDCTRPVVVTQAPRVRWRTAAMPAADEDYESSDDQLTAAMLALILRACR